jgi:hypothetical protein
MYRKPIGPTAHGVIGWVRPSGADLGRLHPPDDPPTGIGSKGQPPIRVHEPIPEHETRHESDSSAMNRCTRTFRSLQRAIGSPEEAETAIVLAIMPTSKDR